MMISKMALPRRTFLRGMGVTLALPLLDAMVPALSAATKPVSRLGFVYCGNGAVMHLWQPAVAEGADFKLSRTLSPLEAFKNQVVVPIGLSHKQAESYGDGNGDHSRGAAAWLSGCHPKRTEAADIRNGTTADQYAAQELGKDTALMSLELATEQQFAVGNCDNGYSCLYENTVSWKTPTTPLPPEVNPRVLFERLFGDGGTAAQRMARVSKDRSLLDWVTNDIARLQKKLGAGDRLRVTEYLDSVREIERRIQVAEAQGHESLEALPSRPVGVPESFQEYVTMMYDLVFLAFQSDITRVFTFQMAKEETNRAYPELGVPEAHHAVSHHQRDPEKFEKGAKINQYHIQLLAHLVKRLHDTPDGDGTLLDHTMLMQGGGLSDADQHSHIDLPVVLVGGGGLGGRLKGGRVVKNALDTPMANLLVAVLDKAGVHVDKIGDSTEPLPSL
ncbi:MAG: DUF1552 domain-containing protein [Acidobacteria bacterium]|nr:DUF1552 domain-containing protein [Acidobacteriota bacterium]